MWHKSQTRTFLATWKYIFIKRKIGVLALTFLLILNILLLVFPFYFGDEIGGLNQSWLNRKHQQRKAFSNAESLFQPPKRRRPFKSILLWNAASRPETGIFGVGHSAFIQNDCEISDCEIIVNRKYRPLEDFDAIIFNFNDQNFVENVPPPNAYRRNPNQRFIFFTQEPPGALKHYDMAMFMQGFNWTMTYRLDSDIPLLYGRVYPRTLAAYNDQNIRKTSRVQWQLENKQLKFAKSLSYVNKTKLVAWMVSHCVTLGRREEYVKELRLHIDVDVFGTCNNNTCGQVWSWDSFDYKCYKMIEANYKFYLSFENSICHDYVTEKFFFMLNYRVVPVVYGGANYSSIAPPHSYIDARHYRPNELAAYLKTLAKNDTLYNEYFQWKKHYTVQAGVQQMARHGFCALCAKLHNDHTQKWYPDLVTQWHYSAQCFHDKSNLPNS